MSSKHIFSSPQGLVDKSLQGAVALNPSLRLHAASRSVYVHSQSPHTKVAVISGGGAGHEPAHASYTGRGMLAASVSGDIFASPSASQIIKAIAFAHSGGETTTLGTEGKNVLVVINNYTGDRLNFGLAIEKARSDLPNCNIESVVVSDDVSLLRSDKASLVGPRGLAGNILVCKILGACAERGHSLQVVKSLGDAVVTNLASIGVGLDHCHVPGRTVQQHLVDDECEIGLGLHNEPGVNRKTLECPKVLIKEMLNLILMSRDSEGSSDGFLIAGGNDDVVLFVNNLGGMSQLEMGALLDEFLAELSGLGIHPVRIYLSSYMTSLNAPGFSASILNISGIERWLQAEGQMVPFPITDVLQLLDDPTEALAWIGARSYWPTQRQARIIRLNPAEQEEGSERLLNQILRSEKDADQEGDSRSWRQDSDIDLKKVSRGVRAACESVLTAAEDMTKFDTIVGDGDCGDTFSAGARGVLAFIDGENLGVVNLAELVSTIGTILGKSMGGTIGALFAIFFTAWSHALQQLPSYALIPKSLDEAVRSLSKYTPARPGDRTIMDALYPFSAALNSGKELPDAARAAEEGAEKTRDLAAKLGRAAYVGGSEHQLPPDPGAWGVAAILHGFVSGYCHYEQ